MGIQLGAWELIWMGMVSRNVFSGLGASRCRVLGEYPPGILLVSLRLHALWQARDGVCMIRV